MFRNNRLYLDFIDENQVLTQQHFNIMLEYCNSRYGPNKLLDIIYKKSAIFRIQSYYSIINKFNDNEILVILKNQHALNNFNLKLINNISSDNLKAIDYIIKNINENDMKYVLEKISVNKCVNLLIDNKSIIKKSIMYELLHTKLYYIDQIIVFKLYKEFEIGFTDNQKDELLYDSIKTSNVDLVDYILKTRQIKIDSKIVDALYKTSEKYINIIVMLLVENGFKVDKTFIIELIKYRKCITNIEQFGIEMDQEILLECARNSYYPESYKYTFKPNEQVLIVECSKDGNYDKINEFYTKGCKYTEKCLEAACLVKNNSKVINFLITKCKIKPTELSIKNFEKAYDIPALTNLIESHLPKKEEKKSEPSYNCLLNTKSLITIEKQNKEFNNETEYTIKSKISKLLAMKSKTCNLKKLYDEMLKYFVLNNLVIGRYILIDETLGNIIKISKGTIIDIDELNTMITYFVKE